MRAEGDLAGNDFPGTWMLGQGNDPQTASYLAEGLQLFHVLQHRDGIAYALDGVAGFVASQHQRERARTPLCLHYVRTGPASASFLVHGLHDVCFERLDQVSGTRD